jgi:hypothetical protein
MKNPVVKKKTAEEIFSKFAAFILQGNVRVTLHFFLTGFQS